ncbi:MAG: nucleoside kinase [Bacteroidales bacterium]|nr:nucleoside kinase [Bacteroidales bacterium]
MTKIEAARAEYKEWCQAIGIDSLDKVNEILESGGAIELINLCEARQERQYAQAADQIFWKRRHCRIVMMSGPSSSGKTSSSLRIAQQARVLGLKPKVIELDNYFVARDETPIDEKGERDYEALEAMDVALLNDQLLDLLAGKEVEIPRFDFKAGHRVFDGNVMRLEEGDILFMEGIHALNPALTPHIPRERIFGIYISALSALPGGEKDHGSTTDKRLLRRIVRDNRVRGTSPEDNILRWPSVRRGEIRNIFPFEENANIIFNSSTLYDIPLLKYFAEPLLCGISESSPAYDKAQSLLQFLAHIRALRPAEIAAIPPTSIMREFIGGQTL